MRKKKQNLKLRPEHNNKVFKIIKVNSLKLNDFGRLENHLRLERVHERGIQKGTG